MKACLLILCLCIALRSSGEESTQTVTPGSERWKQLFDPPYVAPTELPVDSRLRKQLFAILRPPIEKLAKKTVRFQGTLRVYKNWAVFIGQSIGPNNKELRFDTDESLDAVTSAIWLRTHGGWVLVDFHVGLSDWFYPEWFEQYGVPSEFLRQ